MMLRHFVVGPLCLFSTPDSATEVNAFWSESALYALEEPPRATFFTEELPSLNGTNWSTLEQMLQHGQPVQIKNSVKGWPLLGEPCASYSGRFPEGLMRAEYDDVDERMVTVGSRGWHSKPRKVGKSVVDGLRAAYIPKSAPYIWHSKHYDKDLRAVLPWLPRPMWLPEVEHENWAHMNRTIEFWFALEQGGAMAHVDGHCSTIVSVQLCGQKRWRLMFLPELRGAADKFDEADAGVYRAGKWHPQYELEAEPGDVLFFPTGMMHETRSLGEEDCNVAVSFQLAEVPGRLLRSFLPSMLLSQEIARCVDEWAPIATLKQPTVNSDAEVSVMSMVDSSGDGKLDERELVEHFVAHGYGSLTARAALAFHDLNLDRKISRDELRKGLERWNIATRRLRDALNLASSGSEGRRLSRIAQLDETYARYQSPVPSKTVKVANPTVLHFEGLDDYPATLGGKLASCDPKRLRRRNDANQVGQFQDRSLENEL